MKSSLIAVSVFSATLPWVGVASTLDDTNNVAVAILSYAAMDNDDDLDADVEYPVRYTDWNGLLDSVDLPGLTRQDKDAALTDYLMEHSTNDLSAVDGEVRELLRIGLCECRELNHTNALPVVRNFLLNPTSVYMDEPVCLYYKWAKLDEDFFAVTRSFMLNTSSMARKSKPTDFLQLENAINRHKAISNGDAIYTNAVNLVYQFRESCPECAVVLDRFFVSQISGFELSSNRLDTVRGWLVSTNCNSEVRAHCVAVTNQLMNVGHPLAEVESLRGL